MKKILIILGIGYFLLFSVHNVFAIWQGPYEVVEGPWGDDVGQFGFAHGDPNDGFPTKFLIDNYNNIIIADFFNKRVQIIYTNGEVTEFSYKDLNLGWQILQWPSDRIGVYDHIFVEGGFGKYQYYDYQGNLIMQFDVPDSILRMVGSDGSLILQNYKTKKYFKYSPKGQLLKTFNEKPLELGLKKSNRLGDGRYQAIIKYQNITYEIKSKDGVGEQYYRDLLTNFYWIYSYAIQLKDIGIICYRVNRYGRCNETLLSFEMPKSEYEPIPSEAENYPTWSPVPIIEYGEPIISPTGDIYCWARTKDEYKVLKWMWIESPDSPLNLRAETLKEHISLTWERPNEDMDKVAGYEIVRSTEVCGPFEEVGEVKKEELNYVDKDAKEGEVYYYQVRAIKDKGYSGYSNKAVTRSCN